jgi:hypothetical protein
LGGRILQNRRATLAENHRAKQDHITDSLKRTRIKFRFSSCTCASLWIKKIFADDLIRIYRRQRWVGVGWLLVKR